MRRTYLTASAIVLACLVAGLAGGYFSGAHAGYAEATDRARLLPGGAIPCNPGPWGDLSYTPFAISAPDEMIPVRSIEHAGTRWFLAGETSDSFVAFLQSSGMAPELQQQFLAPDVFHPQSDGVLLTPSPDLVFALPGDARAKLYQTLAKSPQNDGQINYIAKDSISGVFLNTGVSADTVAMFKKLSVERGDYFMFSGVGALLARIPDYEEKLHFAKALTAQRTMLLNLHLTPQSDIKALADYWNRGSWGTDVPSIFRSFAASPNGAWMNIQMILPNLPSAEIYDYPNITDNPLDGPPVNRDCAWTSLNFFRDTPNPDFGKMSSVMGELNANYGPLTGQPRYGDLVLVARPDGYLIHLAIYIADDIWFTKNGSNLVHPWMFSTESEVLKQFEFQINPDQKLKIQYLRNKRI